MRAIALHLETLLEPNSAYTELFSAGPPCILFYSFFPLLFPAGTARDYCVGMTPWTRVPRAPAAVLVTLVLTAFFPLPAVAQTEPRDKQALLAFKSAVIDTDQMLAGWDATTDPCIDQWRGVQCTCLTEFEDSNGVRVPICTPLDPAFIGVNSRVLQLNLGDVRITGWNTLGGPLPPELGSLTALRILNLKNNNFTGQIPTEWYALTNLEQLVLSGNNITGTHSFIM